MTSFTAHIVKMHGTGNDFILVDNFPADFNDYSSVARRLCDRHYGIGADGMLVIGDSETADISMRIFNADGSEAQMCGNGIRCIGKYAFDSGRISTLTPTVDTLSGLRRLTLRPNNSGLITHATVDMGCVTPCNDSVPRQVDTPYGSFIMFPISTGNPHGVVFVDDLSSIPVEEVGSLLEHHDSWPEGANIEFVEILDRHTVSQSTWERGVGATLACGTGACATAYAFVNHHGGQWPVTVQLAGGNLEIDLDKATGHLLLTGQAETVFTTDITI